jgi:uncharacterized protein (TIGR02246 family)
MRRKHLSTYQLSKLSVAILMIGVFAALLILATAAARTERSVNPRSNPVGQGSASGVAQISETWGKEWSAGNLNALIALYAEDAVFLPANGSRVTGRSAIRDLFEKAQAVNTSDLRIHSKVMEQSGDLAYDSGEYEETGTSGGVPRSGRGNYLVVFRRQGKNQWRIVEHMWTDAPGTGK